MRALPPDVEARSEGPGQGSEFVVSLPLEDAGEDLPAEPVPSEARDGLAARKVLVIEDNADGRETLSLMLSSIGHVVEVAEDGAEGIVKAARFRPDVVIIDIGLPYMAGHEVARAIRRQPGGHGVYLVALTGYGLPADRQRARDAGFDAYLVKPVEPASLAETLRHRPAPAA